MNRAVVRVWWLMGTEEDRKQKRAISLKNQFAIAIGAGHGSVEIQREDKTPIYITWGAQSGQRSFLGGLSHSSKATSIGVTSSSSYSYTSDQRAYSTDGKLRKEDWACALPLRDPKNASSCGLDGDAMIDWWYNLRTNPHDYTLISKTQNCDGVTVGALIAGGADCYAPPPWNLLYQGAYTLIQWVPKIAANITAWNNRFERVRNLLKHPRLTQRNINRRDKPFKPQIPTVDQWKRMSRVLIGSRNEQVAKIDQYLAEYWSANDPSAWRLEAKKRLALLKILHQVYLHMTLKPNSNRGAAVRELGIICLHAVGELHKTMTTLYNQAQRSLVSSSLKHVDQTFDLNL